MRGGRLQTVSPASSFGNAPDSPRASAIKRSFSIGACCTADSPKRRTAQKVTVPTGVAVFPKEIVTPVRKWMEANFTNIRHWNEMPKGGHFAAFEQPELYVQEVREFFRMLR